MSRHQTPLGFDCERMIRQLLPQMGVPEYIRDVRQPTYFCWATPREDRQLGVDCWVVIKGVEVAVDFTITSDPSLVAKKIEKAMSRGVIPIFFPQTLLRQACNDDKWCSDEASARALRDIHMEFAAQLKARYTALNGSCTTRKKDREQVPQ